jgi:hypothetical protein
MDALTVAEAFKAAGSFPDDVNRRRRNKARE